MNDEKTKKIEVWYQDNYDYQKQEHNYYFDRYFDSEDEAIEYMQEKLKERLLNNIEYNPETSVEDLIKGYKFGGTDYFLKNSNKGFSSWSYVEENTENILNEFKNKKQTLLNEYNSKSKKENFRKKDLFRIIVAGALGIIVQKSFGYNSFSLTGFIIFMAAFALVSFLWMYIFPDTSKESKKIILPKKINFMYVKKSLYIIFGLIVLNTLINTIFYKSGFFDEGFKYKDDTSKAIALNITQKPIETFTYNNKTYYLYVKNKKYFLVAQKNKDIEKNLLTLYSSININVLYEKLKSNKDFEKILKNISPAVYEEVGIVDFVFKPLNLVNSSKGLSWSKEDLNRVFTTIKLYKETQKIKTYNKLLKKNYKNLDEEELFKQIQDIYSYYAFTRDPKYVLNMFFALEKKDLTKINTRKFKAYKLSFLLYIKTFERVNRLNKFISKQNKFVTIKYNFDNKDEPSVIKIKDKITGDIFSFNYDTLNNIKIEKNRLTIEKKDMNSLTLELEEKNIIQTKKAIRFISNSVKTMEVFYEKLTGEK